MLSVSAGPLFDSGDFCSQEKKSRLVQALTTCCRGHIYTPSFNEAGAFNQECLKVTRFGLSRSFSTFPPKLRIPILNISSKLLQVERFFEEFPETGIPKRARLQTLETVRANVRWRTQFSGPVLEWVRRYAFAPWENLRLPMHVLPVHYDLQIEPFLEQQWFQGQVDIEIELLKPVQSVHVHSRGLNITSAFMTALTTKTMVPLSRMFYHEPNEFYVMMLDTVADVGKYSLHYEFRGALTKDLRGFYLSTYPDEGNNTR